MREHVCESNNPPIKALITDKYVAWFSDIDNQRAEWEPYATGLGSFYLPLICRIDPHRPDVYMDRSTNEQDTTTFYNRLLSGVDDWDSDGMSDEWENEYGLNKMLDDAQQDADEDGLINIDEYKIGTYPNDADTDNDAIPDGWEIQYGLIPYVNDASENPDNDGCTNINEYVSGTNPKDADTDDDVMPDGWEIQYGLNPLINDAEGDLDNDSISNLKEYQKGSLPNDPNSKPKTGMPWLPLLLGD